MRLTSLFLGMAAALLISATGGCDAPTSYQSGDASVAGSIEKAAEGTRATRTAHIDITMTIEYPTEKLSDLLHGEGFIDFLTRDYSLKISNDRIGGQLEARMMGGVIYIRIPPEDGPAFPSGIKWVKSGDAAEYNQFPGTPEIRQIIERSPADTLRYLQALNADVTRLRHESIAGDKVTGYHAVVDLDELAAKQLASKQDVAEFRESIGSDQLEMNVWVDRKGLVRQTSMTLRTEIVACGVAVPVEISETDRFSEFGVDVAIEPPDGSTVIADTDPRLAPSDDEEEC
jgi:hypothetical protein